MKEPVLVIMAAGMGSRYGGLKQIDPVGAHGEKIIDYSLFDARRAGFKKALFIIQEELLPDFQEAVFQKVSPEALGDRPGHLGRRPCAGGHSLRRHQRR